MASQPARLPITFTISTLIRRHKVCADWHAGGRVGIQGSTSYSLPLQRGMGCHTGSDVETLSHCAMMLFEQRSLQCPKVVSGAAYAIIPFSS
jgi:hypothetical protein